MAGLPQTTDELDKVPYKGNLRIVVSDPDIPAGPLKESKRVDLADIRPGTIPWDVASSTAMPVTAKNGDFLRATSAALAHGKSWSVGDLAYVVDVALISLVQIPLSIVAGSGEPRPDSVAWDVATSATIPALAINGDFLLATSVGVAHGYTWAIGDLGYIVDKDTNVLVQIKKNAASGQAVHVIDNTNNTFDLTENSVVYVNTTAAQVMTRLPAAPTGNGFIEIIPLANTYATNSLVVLRNGNLIAGIADDIENTTNGLSIKLRWLGGSYGWAVSN